MSMSKKDYEALATLIKRNMETPLLCEATLCEVAHDLADVFAADNPRFDREKFLNACGVAR